MTPIFAQRALPMVLLAGFCGGGCTSRTPLPAFNDTDTSGGTCTPGVDCTSTTPCTVTEPHAQKRCHEGDVYWFDNCGNRVELSSTCGGGYGCGAGHCIVVPWRGLGGSDFGPYDEVVAWGSAGGYGVGGPGTFGVQNPSIQVGGGGDITVSWAGRFGQPSQIYVKQWNGIDWQELAGSGSGQGVSATTTSSMLPALALDASGHPAVAWTEVMTAHNEIYFKRWTGTAWQELAGSASGAGLSQATDHASSPSCAIDAAGNPVIAWTQTLLGASRIHLRHWSGGAWRELAGSASGLGINTTAASAFAPAVAVDTSNRFHVAWCEPTGPFLRYWHGESWQDLGGSSSGFGIDAASTDCRTVSLAVDGTDPVVAWRSHGELLLRQWDGVSWLALDGSATAGGVSNSGGTTSAISLDLGVGGAPIATWTAGPGGTGSVFVRQWTGGAWQELAGSASGTGVGGPLARSYSVVVATGGADPVVAWQESGHYAVPRSRLFLRRYNGTQWQETGSPPPRGRGVSQTRRGSRYPSIVLGADNQPIVAWYDVLESTGSTEIYLKRFNGTIWEELDGSATDVGLSDSPGDSVTPALALDSVGRPVVAWSQSVLGGEDIYLKRWTGSLWEELGGSATWSGISDDGSRSIRPRIAIGPDDNPVVLWLDDGPSTHVYLRKWDGASWQELGGSASGDGIAPVEAAGLGLALDSQGLPVVALGAVQAFRWTGSVWAEVGSGFDVSGDDRSKWVTGMALDAQDRGTVIWNSGPSADGPADSDYQVYGARFDGDRWIALGGSASGNGISNTDARSTGAVMKLDARGNPVVAWLDSADGENVEVYLRRFDGAEWQEILGSASSGGVSNQTTDLSSIDIAVSSDRICVAWEGLAALSVEVAVRCADFVP